MARADEEAWLLGAALSWDRLAFIGREHGRLFAGGAGRASEGLEAVVTRRLLDLGGRLFPESRPTSVEEVRQRVRTLAREGQLPINTRAYFGTAGRQRLGQEQTAGRRVRSLVAAIHQTRPAPAAPRSEAWRRHESRELPGQRVAGVTRVGGGPAH